MSRFQSLAILTPSSLPHHDEKFDTLHFVEVEMYIGDTSDLRRVDLFCSGPGFKNSQRPSSYTPNDTERVINDGTTDIYSVL